MKIKLSRIQEQLWLAERLGQHATAYMVPLILDIKGPVDEDALRASFLDLVARHEILRTRFFEERGELRGEIRPLSEFVFETEFYSKEELEERGGLAGVRDAESGALIDVSRDIPIRAKLIRTADGDQILSLLLHHLAFDDWSRNQLYTELAERYSAHTSGDLAAPPQLAMQYHEYVAQQERRNSRTRNASLAYWREVMEDLKPFEIDGDHPRSARRRGRGASTGFEIQTELATAIRRLGSARAASTAMVLFAAAQLALSRFTGRDDVSFGTTIASRDDDEAQELIGPLINTVLLRGDLGDDPSFAELVERMRDTMLDALEHSGIPFNELVAEYGAVSDLSRNPLSQIIVQYASGVRRRPELAGCEVTEVPVPQTGSKYDVVILFDEFDDGRLRAGIGYDRDLYEAETIQGLADSLRAVIEHVALASETPCSGVPLPTVSRRPASRDSQPEAGLGNGAGLSRDEPEREPGSQTAEVSPEALTEQQQELMEIWRDVLGPVDVTPTSNFFLSGGQSLLALRMTNRTREHLDLDLPLSLIFEVPVFKDFSDRLAQLVAGASESEQPV